MIGSRAMLAGIASTLLFTATAFAAASTSTWTNAGGDGKWSTPANWSPAGAPAAGSDLIFPGGANATMTNDLAAGISFHNLQFDGCPYRLKGNSIAVTGDLAYSASCSVTFIESDVRFDGPVHTISGFPFEFDGAVEINGTINLANHSAFNGPLRGSGTISDDWHSPEFHGGGTFTGALNLGTAGVFCDLPTADVAVDRFYGNGSVGNLRAVSITLGTTMFSTGSVGVVQTKNLTTILGNIYPDTTIIDILPDGFDHIITKGTVTLAGKLGLGVVTAPLTVGHSYVIIDNDGTDAVNGTFDGLPEGSFLTGGSAIFKLSYRGGDGNDVTLTVDRPVRKWTGAGGNNLWSNAANWSPSSTPVSGDSIDFPAGTGAIDVVDDLAGGSTFGTISFERPVHISGNSFTVGERLTIAGVDFFENNPLIQIDNDVTFAHPQDIPHIRFRGRALLLGNDAVYNTFYARFEGPLDGPAVIRPSYSAFVGGGNLSGTIIGESPTEIAGGFPNADVAIQSDLYGSGIVGQLYAFTIHPGAKGTTDVASFQFAPRSGSLGSLAIDITQSDNDRVVITAPVQIQFASLAANVRSGSPAAGTTYTIIDNRTSSPISGTFTGLPEAATLDAGGTQMRISYRGGDGNDVTLTVVGAAKRWTGAAHDGRMSNPANWSPAVAPQSGESLSFPSDSATNVVNDLAADTQFESVAFANGYRLTGNRMVITKAFTWESSVPVGADLKFSGDVTINANETFNGDVEVNGHVTVSGLQGCYSTTFNGALNGSGSIDGCSFWMRGAGGTFAGTVSVLNTIQIDGGAFPGMNVTAGSFYGSGSMGDLNAGTVTLYAALRTKAFAITNTEPDWLPSVNFTLPAKTLQASRVTLLRPLAIDFSGPLPVGSAYTLIDNTGSEPVHGTFLDRPEGSVWTSGTTTFRISYKGGDGNDVTVSVVTSTLVTLTQSASTSGLGENVTLTATATSSGTPASGTMSFYRDATLIGTANVVNGTATLVTHFNTLGTNDLIATFLGTSSFANGSSSKLTHTTVRALPHLTVNDTEVEGRHLLSVSAPRGENLNDFPSGTISIVFDGTPIANSLAGGAVAFPLGRLESGVYPVAIHYAGDATYEAADMTYNLVVPAPVLDVHGSEVKAGDTASIVLRLSSDSRQAISVRWQTADGTAIAGKNYVAANGVVTFPPHTTEARLTITTLTAADAAKTFFNVRIDSNDATVRYGSASVVITPVTPEQRTRDLVYAMRETGPLTLDLYVPITATAQAEKMPLVTAIEADDWSMLPSREPIALRETAHGFAVAVVRFRTSIDAKFPAQMDDVKDAIAWLQRHGAEYSIDGTRIALWGIGAGGHLAALAAMHDHTTTPVLAVVDWYGASDLTIANNGSCSRLGTETSMLLGCSPDQCPDTARSASPAFFASKDDPPFLIMHGGNDCSISTEQSKRLDDALRAAGVWSSLDIIANVGGQSDPAWLDPAIYDEVDAFLNRFLRAPARKHAVR